MKDVIYLPIELVRAFPVSMDIGSSLSKILYRAKQDRQYNSDLKLTQGKLRFASMPIPASEEELAHSVVSFLQEHCDFGESNEEITVKVTGVQVGKVATSFKKHFGIKFTYDKEGTDMANAIIYFIKCQLKLDDIFYPLSEEGVKEGNELSGPLKDLINLVVDDEKSSESNMTPCSRQPIMLPCILALLGTSNGCIVIQEDGTFRLVELTWKGGRAFHALAKLLTGETDFEKIIELASKGNRRNVNNTIAETMPTTTGPDNPYDKQAYGHSDLPSHVMGKMIRKDKESVNHEDLLDSLLSMFVADFAQMNHLVALVRNIPRLYFCGSLVVHEHIRRLITRELTMRHQALNHDREPVVFEFLKHGGHLAAIGAYLSNIQLKERNHTKH